MFDGVNPNDTLTKIASKETFLVKLQQFLRGKESEEWCVAAIDIQHFNLYNDWYGKAGGDALLTDLAICLSYYQDEMGYPVGYFGDDDFFICLPDNRELISSLYRQLQDCVHTNANEVSFFVIMGICPVQEHPDADSYTLCNYARIAAISPSKVNCYINYFQRPLLEQLKWKHQMVTELRHALEREEFIFYLQPKCNSMTYAIVGMEALARWDHPTRGIISPYEFIPFLEENGLVAGIDLYIWKSVCKMLQRWKQEGRNIVPISVNISVADIMTMNVAQVFRDLVKTYQIEPRFIQAEITESVLAESIQQVRDTMSELRRNGFCVLMDDFGSGYSSLNMLKEINVDAIKLDMNLIDLNQQNYAKGVQIVKSVVEMAHEFDVPVIAEGVETQEQMCMLQSVDCLYGQGYYFYKPMSIERAERLLEKSSVKDYWDLQSDFASRERCILSGIHVSSETAATLQAFQILSDYVMVYALLNLQTGVYRVLKRNSRLPDIDIKEEEDFSVYCNKLICEMIIHPDDMEDFRRQINLPNLYKTLLESQSTAVYRYRKYVSNQFEWLTMEIIPCHNFSESNPWSVVLVREDVQANRLTEELNFAYTHDTQTGLLNRNKYEADLRNFQRANYRSITCVYIDAIGLHEVNNYTGHESGDRMLACIAKTACACFENSFVYRIGGDEFVVLSPNQGMYDAKYAVKEMRERLKLRDYEVSVGISFTRDMQELAAVVNRAEAAMRQEKELYYKKDGKKRQLRGLNIKLENILKEKHDTERFLQKFVPKYTGVYIVDLQKDTMRCVIAPEYFREMMEVSHDSFRMAMQNYCNRMVQSAYYDKLQRLLNYDYIREKIWAGEIVECFYVKTDHTLFSVRVYPYSENEKEKNMTMWVFSLEDDSRNRTTQNRVG